MIKARTLRRTGKKVYDVRLRDPSGRVYGHTFATKREAEAFEASETTDRRRGSWIDPRPASRTVGELGVRWLESNPAKRSGTKARDESIFRRHIVSTFGTRPIGSVTQPGVQALVNGWAKAALLRTVKRQYGVLHAIFEYAVNADFLARTPCRDIKVPQARPLQRKLPSADQLVALADELGPYGLMVWVGVITGLRWGEVAGLRVGSVDLLRGELKVNRATNPRPPG